MAFGFNTCGTRMLSAYRQGPPIIFRRRRPANAIELLESRVLLTTYYVSNLGSDSNGGTSSGTAWATLQKAANNVVAGDTVHVAAGTYRGFYLSSTHSGTASSRIAFLADPGATINQRNSSTLDGINLEGADYITIDGFTLTGTPDPAVTRAGIRVVGSDPNNTALYNKGAIITNNVVSNWGVWGIFTSHADNIEIENNSCSGSAQQHGIYVSNACVGPIVRHNISYNNAACGIHMNGDLSMGGTGLITGALVENNIIYNNGGGSAFSGGGGSAINCDGVTNSTFRNNLLYGNHANGISLYAIDGATGSNNNVVVNNTIVAAADGRYAININTGATNNRLYNNIIVQQNPISVRGCITIDSSSLTGFVSDYNVFAGNLRFSVDGADTWMSGLPAWRAATGQDAHSLTSTTAALFVSTAGSDYHLAAGSPAIDAGTSTSAPANDLEGNSRPIGSGYDVGCYEMDTVAPTVTAVYVRGSTWNANYLSFLAANMSGSSATYGYAIPVGSGAAQLQTLPWRNLNQISIAFSEDVSVAQAQFAIAGSVGSYSVSGFAYSSADHVATWSLSAAIGPDKLYVALPGSGSAPVADLAGNVLDGEWSNPSSYSDATSTSVFPSGNGTAGGDFAFRFDVLPGDSTGGSLGKVNVADALQTKSRSGLPISTSTYRSDFDGNNLVNVADVAYAKSKSSVYSLPVNPPVLPVFSQVSLLLFREDLLLGYV